MLALLFYYLVLPLLLGALVIRFIRRSGALEPPRHIRDLYAAHPIEQRMFRAARLEDGTAGKAAVLLGDFETLSEAVDAIYAAREKVRQAGGRSAAFIALNDQGEVLEEVEI